MRVLLADDHALVRAGIRALLTGLPDVESVIEAGDGQEALSLLRELRPDVALVDIAMPGLNGLELAARVDARGAGDAPRDPVDARHARARGAGAARRRLRLPAQGLGRRRAARAVARGDARRDLSVADDLEAGRRRLPGPHVVAGHVAAAAGTPDGSDLDVFTSRQREILQLVAEGKSTKEVAQMLDLSVKTVETHRAQIMDRLGIRDLAGLVRYAVRTGLVSTDR